MPRLASPSTIGSMAMETSQASRRMKRNDERAWNAQNPIERATSSERTTTVALRTLAGLKATQVGRGSGATRCTTVRLTTGT